LSQRHCQLGLAHQGAAGGFEDLPAYDALEKPHADIHDLSQQILLALGEGATRETLTGLLHRMTRKSGEVLTLLQAMELEALLLRGGRGRCSAGHRRAPGPCGLTGRFDELRNNPYVFLHFLGYPRVTTWPVKTHRVIRLSPATIATCFESASRQDWNRRPSAT
jgi:hypothetical protein